MKFFAWKKDTGLSEDYLLETKSTPTGTIVTVYGKYETQHGAKSYDCIGQFTNNRQGVEDNRPLENIVKYDTRIDEVLAYFGKQGKE